MEPIHRAERDAEGSSALTGTDAPLLERVGDDTWRVNVEELKKRGKKTPEEMKKMKSKVKRYYQRQNRLITEFEEMELVGRPHTEGEMQQERDAEEARDIRVKIAVYGSLAANIMLFGLNVFNALTSASYSVLAAALDSFLDIFSGFILWLCSFAVDRTTRLQYPGGKSRFEPLGVIVFSACMFTATLQLITEAGKKLFSGPSRPDISRQSLILIMIAIGTKLGLFLFCRTIAGSTVVKTLAMDHRNDIIMNSFGTLCALGGFYFKWWIDPAGAICIGLYIMTVWARNGWEQVRKLSGRSADNDFLQALTYLTWNHSPHILKIDTVRAFHLAEGFIVEVDIVLPREMPLIQAHDIGESLQFKLEEVEEVERAFVHLDYEVSHKPEH